ncbi:hypothetical protein F383_21932 [Gossypium arboreum]|uniref:Uncharacterized protein n=1 Tax=Gossypium arboreum TaxID=29729 RepID=A0A0B0NQD2_GOSAR|nr:hypothetical protein F383_21932 [Gossypium arboreum]
MCCKKGFSSDG